MSAESRPRRVRPWFHSHRARQGRDASNGAHYGDTFRLQNSTVTIRDDGTARIERHRDTIITREQPTETIEALAEVAERV